MTSGWRDRDGSPRRWPPTRVARVATGPFLPSSSAFRASRHDAVGSSSSQLSFRRLEVLPSNRKRLVRTAAAETVGDPPARVSRGRAARIGRRSGRSRRDIGPGWPIGDGSDFPVAIPGARGRLYRSASGTGTGARCHRALAEVTSPTVDPYRRAGHLAAAAAVGPDEGRRAGASSGRPASQQARGGLAAAARSLQRSFA